MKWIMMNEWFETKYIPPKLGKNKTNQYFTKLLLSDYKH